MHSSAVDEPLATRVDFTADSFVVTLNDGRTVSAALADFPRLKNAAENDRASWTLIAGGSGIHWETLDEDISVAGLLGPSPKFNLSDAERNAVLTQMSALLSAQDWARLLKLLMMYPAVPKHSENAFLRARCHEGLGDRETACAFLEDAVRLEPDNVGPRMLAIMLLSQIGDHEGALALAQPALLNRDKAHPKLLIAAAKAMFNRGADRPDEAAAREDAAEVCRILENALPRHSALAANERLKSLAIDGFAHLAMSRHVLGDVRGAEAALSCAFDLDPANRHLLKLRQRLSAGAATSRELRETFSDAA